MTDAFTQIMAGLMGILHANRFKRVMALPLVTLICKRFDALYGEFNLIARQLRQGTLPAPRQRAEALARAPSSRLGVQRPASLVPSNRGWLNQIVPYLKHEIGTSAARLERLLADPDMQAMIAAAPLRVGRILRSLCWMMNVDHKGVLPPRPRRAHLSRRREAVASAAGARPGQEAERPAVAPPAFVRDRKCRAKASFTRPVPAPVPVLAPEPVRAADDRPELPHDVTPEQVALLEEILAYADANGL